MELKLRKQYVIDELHKLGVTHVDGKSVELIEYRELLVILARLEIVKESA